MNKMETMNFEISQGDMLRAKCFCLSLSDDDVVRVIGSARTDKLWCLYVFLNVYHQTGEFLSNVGEKK